MLRYQLITPITLRVLLIPTVGAIAVYRYATIDKGREERPPSPKENVTPTLLPAFWHSMMPADRKVVMTVVQSHGYHYTAVCLEMLRFECRLSYSLMSDVPVCVTVSREHPQSLNFEMLAATAASASEESDGATPQAVANIYTEKKSVNDKLTHFMLIPKDDSGNAIMKGNVLFDHMSTYRNVHHASALGKGTDEDGPTLMHPSANLCVHLYPDLLKSIQPTANQLHHGAITS